MKIFKIISTLLAIAVLFVFSRYFFTQSTPIIPREVLFGNPAKKSPRISPNGNMIAYLAPVNNILNVWMKTIGKDDDRPITKDTRQGIQRFFWVQNSKQILFLQDKDGDENDHLYQVDLNTLQQTDLTPFNDVKVKICAVDKHFPNEIIVLMNKENPKLFDAYRLNLISGETTLVAKNPGNIDNWLADTNLKIRAAVTSDQDGGETVLVRKDENSEWQSILKWNFEDAFESSLVGFSKDGDSLYLVDSSGLNVFALKKLEISTRKEEIIAQDPKFDVTDVLINPDTYKPEAVCFGKERSEWQALDVKVKEDFEVISKIHDGDLFFGNRLNIEHKQRGGDLFFGNRTFNDDLWIISFIDDNGPIPFYIYDRKTKKAEFLFFNRPDLSKYKLSPMKPISFTSRDGLTIHSYITYPLFKSQKKLPMVLFVHGGPWSRDSWEYNPEAQWFANRGYVCLQVNFRGSSGYGKKFVNAGNKEWGRKMHNDLVDAVGWAIKNANIDPDKVAIFGRSYGGYAALVGATFTPDLFCCAVDIVGPSNLNTLINSIPSYWKSLKMQLLKRVGNPETEKDFLNSRSPLFKIDQIKIPMLIAQGANDPRVKQSEAEQVVAAMKEKGIEYEYVLFPDEGHVFYKPQNELKFFATVEKFLAKHLGGRFEK